MIGFRNVSDSLIVNVEERSSQVQRALASIRLEGLEPTAQAKRIFERYVDGEITIDEMQSQVCALNAREFGSVPVPGD